MTPDLRLYLVTDTRLCGEVGVPETVSRAIDGGVTLVQVRDPDAGDDQFLALAREVVAIAKPRGVPVLLNDRVHLVLAAGAQGAHVGQGDLPVAHARSLLPDGAVLGLSVTSSAELDEAAHLRPIIDYVGVGPVWAPQTKPDAAPPIGLVELGRIAERSPWPAVAIGGIGISNVGSIREAGCAGAAVVSAICGTPDPGAAAARLLEGWQR